MHAVLRLVAVLAFGWGMMLSLPAHAQAVDELWQTYSERDAEYERLRSAAEALPPDTTQGDRAYREAAVAAGELADVIEELLLRDDSLGPDEVEAAIDRLLTVRQVQGSFLADVRACDDAVDVLTSVMQHPGIEARSLLRERTSLRLQQAEACAAGEEMVLVPETDVPPSAEASGGTRGAGIALLATGGALLAGGLGWDLAVAGDVSDFESMRDTCDRGEASCDTGVLDDLSGTIDTAKIGTGALYGAGAISAITGIILVVVDRPEAETRQARVAPWVGRHGVGVRASVRF